MKNLASELGAVKRAAQNRETFRPLPPLRGGYRTWPFDQRRVTIGALRDQLVQEGMHPSGAWEHAYAKVKSLWLDSLSEPERAAYLTDAATAAAIKDKRRRRAFWNQTPRNPAPKKGGRP